MKWICVHSVAVFMLLSERFGLGQEGDPTMAETNAIVFNVGSGSNIRVDGTTKYHDWNVGTETIKGTISIAGKLELQPKVRGQVSIPTKSLAIGSQEAIAPVQQALKAEKFPEIAYTLTRVLPKLNPSATDPAGGIAEYEVEGILTLAGVKKPFSIPVKIRREREETLSVEGHAPISMLDFDIPPPVLGATGLKTGKSIMLHLHLVLVSRAERTP